MKTVKLLHFLGHNFNKFKNCCHVCRHPIVHHSSVMDDGVAENNRRKRCNRHILIIFLIVLLFLCTFQVFLTRGSLEAGNNKNVELDNHNLKLTRTINHQRQEYLKRQCHVLGYSMFDVKDLTKEQMDHMVIDQKHKILYCYVPKVACTNWKRILMIINGSWQNGTDPLQIPHEFVHTKNQFTTFSNLNETVRKQAMSEYTRFLFVRHPFERILSAYRDKFEGDSLSSRRFHKQIGRNIVKTLRPNASKHSLKFGNDVTFAEFIEYVLTLKLSLSYRGTYNEHWEPMSRLCNPCVMKYNVIGKYETLLDDSALALHLIGASNMTFPEHRSLNTSTLLRQYFDPLPISTIRKLYDIYVDDFKLFDYNLQEVIENLIGQDLG